MAKHKRVTKNEMNGIRVLVKGSYPGRQIVDVLAEKWEKHPREEGLELEKVGLALMISSGRNDLYQKVITGQYDCFIDTFYDDPCSSDTRILLVVIILEKYDPRSDSRQVEELVHEAEGFLIRASILPTPGDTYELRIHELSHSSGITTGRSKNGFQLARNVTRDYVKALLASFLEIYNESPFEEFVRTVEEYRRNFSD